MRKALLPLLLVTIPVIAQPIYSYKDSNGNIVYTNQQPPANSQAEEVRLPKLQTMSTEQLQKELAKDTSTDGNVKQPVISQVVINGIPSDEALRSNNGTFTVTVSLNTADGENSLPPSYQYILLLDGRPYAGPQASPSFTLTSIDRGTHTIQAQILNKGSVVATSNAESFTLQRVAQPARRVTPQPKAKN